MFNYTLNNNYENNNKNIMKKLKKNLKNNIGEEISIDYFNASTRTINNFDAIFMSLENNYIAFNDLSSNTITHLPFAGENGLIISIIDKNNEILYYNPYCLSLFLNSSDINTAIEESKNVMFGPKKAKSLNKKLPRF